ncbi:MAG: FAD-dependent oxidoreductase [Armatimonadota bacterium]|nr:FAD-dependent oxidoreductase [Armatimonadota bacterium]MDR7550448.1 FAD-dependent oxidoreductase [Armatimonadota bacterium]
MANRAVVIGGGAIGVAAAHSLTLAGWQVTLIDRGEVGRGCSYANACLVTASHAVPLPAPEVPRELARWLLRPDSPVYVKPRLDPGFLRWGWRFLHACRAPAAQRGTAALGALARASLGLFEEMVAAGGVEFGYRRDGLLHVYLTEGGVRKAARDLEALQRAGIPARLLTRAETLEFEPTLAGCIRGGMYVEGDAHGDCYAYVRALAVGVQARGGRVLTGRPASLIRRRGGRVEGVEVRGPEGVIPADLVVVAAGAWTPSLLAPLGVRFPMEPAKGYSCTLPGFAGSPAVPVFVEERRVAITPLDGRLRVGGTLELAGYREGIHPVRYRAVVDAAQEVLGQTLPLDRAEAWEGFRPLPPDGLPVISRVPGIDGLLVAAGHGTLGFTLSPITGRLVADLAEGRPPMVPLEAFRLDRF